MARNESDHEDLMSEAVSLVRRIEYRYQSRQEPSVIGFNRLGWLFVYLGSDPMYRFDERGRLRRAFVDHRLYRTTGKTLAVLERHRTESTIDHAAQDSILLRRDLSPAELVDFRDRMRDELEVLKYGLKVGTVLRQHPADLEGIITEVQDSLDHVLTSAEFLAPAIVSR